MPKLYKHQQKLLDENPPRWLLGWACGSGKTIATIALANKNCGSLLVVCPKGLRYNWYKNLTEHSTVPIRKVVTKEEFRRDWNALTKYDGIIVDEAHTFAGMTSLMSKNMTKYLKKWDIRYRWFATATPYLSSPWNIFMLASHLGHHLNYAYFKATFFYDVTMGLRTVPMVRPGMEEDLKQIVLRIGSTVSLDECIDMPPQIYETEYFELTPAQAKAIKGLAETNHIARWTKIHQICGGSVAADEYNPAQRFPSLKRERVRQIAEENGRVIVVCRYLEEIEALAEALEDDIPVFRLTGATKDRATVLEWVASKDRYVLLVSASISEGWELPNCDVMVFCSYSFSLKDKVQMEGRIMRINNPHKNTYISLVVKGTIDEDVFETLKEKNDFHLSLYKKAEAA